MALVPYIQVVVQWLTALANTIAGFFGFKIDDYLSDTSGLEGISSGIGDIGTSAGNANKELNKMLNKFDELNVIDFDKATGSGGGGSDVGTGGSLGIPLPDYDALSGALTKNLEEVEKKLKSILPYFIAIGAALLTWKVGSGIINLLKTFGLLNPLLKKTGLSLGSLKLKLLGISLIVGGAVLYFKGMIDIFDKGKPYTESLSKALVGLGIAVGGVALVFGGIPALVVAVIGAIGILISTIARFPNEIKSGMDKATNWINNTIDKDWRETFGPLLGGIMNGGVSIFKDFWSSINDIVKGTVDFISGIFEGDWNKAWKGFIQNAQGFGNLLKDILVAPFKAAWSIIISVGTQLLDWLSNFSKWVIEKLGLQPLIDEITGTFQTIWNIIVLIWSKAQPFFEGIGNGIKNVFDFVAPYISTAFELAWTTIKVVWNVAITFFKVIWEGIKSVFSVVKEILGGFFGTAWTTIKSIWNVAVSFFTLVWAGIKSVFAVVESILSGDFSSAWEAIKNVWDKAIGFFQSIWDGIKSIFGSVGSWFGNVFSTAWENIKSWFTWEKWWNLAQDAINGIKSAFENLDIKIKLPHFSWTSTPAKGWIADVLSALNLPTSLPKLNVSWYAEGGFPDTGELFVAREAGPELVGNIGNKAAVANNDQIVEGIAQAAYQGVSQAMRENKGNERQPVNVYIGNKKVYSGYGQYISSENNMYGASTVRV